ncbi:unnamed protein product [Dicrocoelium dendriticum]|nr:unnamed protein product [Dicrocoelium dendriticum]
MAADTIIAGHNQLLESAYMYLEAAALHLPGLPEGIVTSATDKTVFRNECKMTMASSDEVVIIKAVLSGAQPTAAFYGTRQEPRNATAGEQTKHPTLQALVIDEVICA